MIPYYYNGRKVKILKEIKIINTVIIQFIDNEKELRCVKKMSGYIFR